MDEIGPNNDKSRSESESAAQLRIHSKVEGAAAQLLSKTDGRTDGKQHVQNNDGQNGEKERMSKKEPHLLDDEDANDGPAQPINSKEKSRQR